MPYPLLSLDKIGQWHKEEKRKERKKENDRTPIPDMRVQFEKINVILVFTSVIKFSCKLIYANIKIQAPVVQKVDSTIYWINLYPVHSAIGFPYT